MKRAILLPLVFVLVAAPLRAQDATPLRVGERLSGTLSSDSKHTNTLSLSEEMFVFGRVDQVSVDVVVTITGPDGGEVAEFDGPSRGPENFMFTAKGGGTYVVTVAPFEGQAGDYGVLLQKVERIATNPARRIDQLMTPYAGDDTPGVVVGVLDGGRVVLERAYGMVDLSFGVPYEIGTPTNIGSVTKQFTAMAILLLRNDGLLSLDDEVRKHIPELPDFGTPVTLKHLLNHTGGFREIYNFLPMDGREGEDHIRREEAIEIVQRQPELQAAPNVDALRSRRRGRVAVGAGPFRVGRGRGHLHHVPRHDQVDAQLPGRRRGRPRGHPPHDDAQRARERGHHGVRAGDRHREGAGPDTLRPHRRRHGPPDVVQLLPRTVVADEEGVDAAMSSERMEAIAGDWIIEAPGLPVTFSVQNGELWAEPRGQSRIQVTPTSDSTVVHEALSVTIVFHFDADGSVSRATFTQGQASPMTRVEPEAMGAEEMQALAGRYYSRERELWVELRVEAGGLVLDRLRAEPLKLSHRSELTFSGTFPFAEIVLQRASNGSITGLVAGNGRTKGVLFVRE